jgi:hypothetical protein
MTEDIKHQTLSGRVDVLEHAVVDLKNVVTDMSKDLKRFVERVSEQPRPIPFKEIITTAAATLGLLVGVLSFLDARADTKLDARMKDQAAPMAVLQYRIDQLEKAKN